MKKISWQKIKGTLRGLGVLIVAALLLQLVSGIQYYYSKTSIEDEARKLAEIRLKNANLLVEAGMNSVEVAVENVTNYIKDNLDAPDRMFDISRGLIEVNSTLAECGLLFVPDYYLNKAHSFHPYSYRTDDGSILTNDHNLDGFNYYNRPWYTDVIEKDVPKWTDPYFSHIDNNLICTYSTPIKDKGGKVVAVLYADISLEWLRQLIEEGAGEYNNAYSVILNKLGEPVIDTRNGDIPPGFYSIEEPMVSQERGERKITYRDTVSYAFYGPIGKHGWSMAIVCPEKEIFADFRRISNLLNLLALLGLGILGFILYQTGRGLAKLRKEEGIRQRMENELNIAHGIQMGMVPKTFPPFPERDDIEIYASLDAAREVGGDLYDYFISNGKLWFCIGDVSGKGVPASLVMAVTRSLFRSEAMHQNKPEVVMKAINESMGEMNDTNMFVTMFIGCLDLNTGKLSFCNAGHNPPVICAEDSATKVQLKPNLPLSLLNGYNYVGESMTISDGNTLFLYTDGLTEAENTNKELFGEDRMMEVLHRSTLPSKIISEMSAAVSVHTAGAQQNDDLTMLAIRFWGTKTKHLEIRNEISQLSEVPAFIEDLCTDSKIQSEVNLALEEALVNIVDYAYEKPGEGLIQLDASRHKDTLKMVLTDSGKPFDPTATTVPDINLPPEERPVGGLGILLVRKLMDTLEYERKDDKNILTMTKKIA